jgi:16S rRNA (adenine1518-N6/adenine1519-N6)-dimethyltransferase
LGDDGEGRSPPPRKRFGQHFLEDPATIGEIVRVIAPRLGEPLVEIGPGEGALTCPLLQALGRLTIIELDRDRIGPLTARCAPLGELTVIAADCLRVRLTALAPPGGRIRVVGNLPYNISTPLLFHLLEDIAVIEDMVFLLQREVAERLAAPPGGRDYGRLSVMIQAQCRVDLCLAVGPEVFRPPPKVHSTLVRLVPRREVTAPHPEVFARLVQAAFGQRRKTLRNALAGHATVEDLAAAGIDPVRRAETLAVDDFRRLAAVVAAQREGMASVPGTAWITPLCLKIQ